MKGHILRKRACVGAAIAVFAGCGVATAVAAPTWGASARETSARQKSAHVADATKAGAGSNTIYVIGYNTNAFWSAEEKGAQLAGKLLNVPVKFEFGAGPSASNTLMEQAALAAVAAHPAGIAIDYLGKFMQKPVLAALKAGEKVVLFNNNRFGAQNGGATTDPSILDLGYSGQDEHLSGAKLADAFLRFLPPGGGTVLIGNAVPQAYVLTLRYEGVKAVLQAHGYKTHLLLLTTNGVQDESEIGAYLLRNPTTVGFIGLSGDIETDAAAEWVATHHLKLPLATFDIDPTTVQLMKTVPSFDVALDQQPFLQAFYAVFNLEMQIRYGFEPIQMNTGSLIITKSNLALAENLVKEGVD